MCAPLHTPIYTQMRLLAIYFKIKLSNISCFLKLPGSKITQNLNNFSTLNLLHTFTLN